MATIIELADLVAHKAYQMELAGFDSPEDLSHAILGELWCEQLPADACTQILDILSRVKSRIAKREQRTRARLKPMGDAMNSLPDAESAQQCNPRDVYRLWRDWRREIRAQSGPV
jgi:hypothetical protein